MTWHTPRRFLLVFMQRSGSTFLAHCLDSHPDLGAERGEPLHPEHVWRRTWPEAAPEALLSAVLDRPGYHATVARANYRHAMTVDPDYLRGLDGLLFLHRENMVRNMVSSHVNAAAVKAIHAFEPQATASIVIDPDDFLRGCRRSDTKREETLAWLRSLGAPLYVTTYEAVTGGATEANGIPEAEAERLCAFLGVRPLPLVATLRRINPEPPSLLVANWAELAAVISESEYAECLTSM